jgi:hypothetical protein
LEPVKKVLDSNTVTLGEFLMWYGYAFEAIYVMLGTMLGARVLGILIYH